MYKAICNNKIIAVVDMTEGEPFPFMIYDEVIEDKDHVADDYSYLDGEFVLNDSEKAIRQEKLMKIDEEKAFLASTDYVVIKIAEGVSTKEEYADVLAQRNEAREIIETLTAELNLIGERIADGLKAVDGAYIDTGLTLDGSYTFETVGYTPEGLQSVLVGAYETNQMRTELKLLGASNKLQACWPSLTEMTSDVTGIDCRQMFTAKISANKVEVTQGDVTYTRNLTNTSPTILNNTPILLFNETPEGNFNNGVISEVKIRDGEGNILRHFQAYKINDECVMVDTVHKNQIYRPVKGSLVEA